MKIREGLKGCPHCGEVKRPQDFCRNRTCSDGLSAWCRVCMVEAVRSWRYRNPEKQRALTKRLAARYRERRRKVEPPGTPK
jgi:hypothetical protein